MQDIAIEDLAKLALTYLETRVRDGGREFIACKDDAPEWVLQLLLVHQAARDDMLPNDDYSTMAYDALLALAERVPIDVTWKSFAALTNAKDFTTWQANRDHRQARIRQAIKEGFVDSDASVNKQLKAGYLVEARDVLSLTYEQLKSRLNVPHTDLPVIDSCDDCGACCSNMHHPQGFYYVVNCLGDPVNYPRPLRDRWTGELNNHGWFTSAPPEAKQLVYDSMEEDSDEGHCCWLDTETMRCRFYEHRPNVCRDFVMGSEDCHEWRKAFHGDSE